MNKTNVTPKEIFNNPEAWFAGFGITVTQVSGHRRCPICVGEDIDDRIAA